MTCEEFLAHYHRTEPDGLFAEAIKHFDGCNKYQAVVEADDAECRAKAADNPPDEE